MVADLLCRFITRQLAPAGANAKLSIFIFHRVLPDADPLLPFEPSAEQFEWMVRYISRTFNVLSLGEAVRLLQAGRLPAAAAVITFDDGYADNYEVAWPILKRFGVVATFFIATAFLDGGRMWNDDVIEAVRHAPYGKLDFRTFELGIHQLVDSGSRVKCYESILGKLKYFEHRERSKIARNIAIRSGVPDMPHLMMTRRQLRSLHDEGAEIGGHTISHPILELLDDAAAQQEIECGKVELESILGSAVRVFAYPNGVPGRDCSARHGEMARRVGFEAAVSTKPACATLASDVFQLPRFTPWERTPFRFAMRSILHLYTKSDDRSWRG